MTALEDELREIKALLAETLAEVKSSRAEQQATQKELTEQRVLVEQCLDKPAATAPRADDLVKVEYLEGRIGLSARTILAGKAGTKSLLRLRVQKHPSLWRRADVDRWVNDLVELKKNEGRARLVRRRSQFS